MLVLLDDQELMTARLVCSEWRQASLTFMAHLNLNSWLDSTGMQASNASLEALARCWQVLPNLSSLAFRIYSPHGASLLGLPSCASALKRLHVQHYMNRNRSAGAIAAEMAPIARLTGLTLFSASAPSWRDENSPYRPEHAQFLLSTGVILVQCTRLCKVDLYSCRVGDWLLLLPLLAGLPNLRLLGDVRLWNEEIVAGVASMTQLTFVRGSDNFSNGLHLQPLLQLPALRARDLNVGNRDNWPALLRAFSQARPQLAHFSIHVDVSVPFEALLAPMSGLTLLYISGHSLDQLPHHLWQFSLAHLQEFRWFAADMRGGVALPISWSWRSNHGMFPRCQDWFNAWPA